MYAAGKSDHREVREKAPNNRRKGERRGWRKTVDQGEQHGATHGPDPEQDSRVPGTTWCAGSRTRRSRTKVYGAPASRQRKAAAGQFRSAEERGCAGSGSSNVGRV